MVQKEVRKKTRVYGVIAVLSAIILVATIYTISSPTVLTSLSNVSPMKTFASIDELKNFLTANTKADSTGTFSGGPLDAQHFNTAGIYTAGSMAVPAPALPGQLGITQQQPTYSTTNIQVAGVDEADTVKTDGKYIYTAVQDYAAASQNTIYIVKADPQDPEVIAKIALGNNTYPAGMYLSQDGNKLVILGSNYGGLVYAPRPLGASMGISIYGYYANDVSTFIYVYDVSDKANPSLARNYTISGSYFNSRMIGDYVYAVVSQPAYLDNQSVILPEISNGAVSSTIQPTKIYYTDMQDSYFTYTTFAGLNVNDDSQAPSNMTIMMGGTSDMYVSQNNMYITYPDKDGQGTDIYRIGINGQALTFEAKGAVPGYVLNQYSMDEYNGNFRVATTTSTGSWINQAQQNNLYVLNNDLTIVGKLENLAQGERIYSARFMGDKCYLVTFKQTDPFFVIDLRNPAAPVVAGELKIPGYSSYLHPYDENHVIGLGMENSTLKLSLFDVTDINNPTEIAKYTVQGDYSSSGALYDPKAFLFDLQKQLLVIPVSVTNYGQTNYKTPESVPPVSLGNSTSSSPDSNGYWQGTYENSYWQGAYVFKLTPQDGFTLKGQITHQDNTTNEQNIFNYDQTINRALYIDNTLYTISNSKIQLNDLDNLNLVSSVNLG